MPKISLTKLRRLLSIPDYPDPEDWCSVAHAAYETAPESVKTLGLPLETFKDQRILEVGCGLGGKTAFYAEHDPRLLVGIDISEKRAKVARAFLSTRPFSMKAQIVIADASQLPFRGQAFDLIISTDTWEHLRAPDLALRDCVRVARPGGLVAITAVPYFSPWGAHAWYWLPLPWIQLLFPRIALFWLLARLESLRQINRRLPEPIRMDWRQPADPAHAQRLTVSRFESFLHQSDLSPIRFDLLPIGSRYGRFLAWINRRLVRIPWLRELLAGLIILVARNREPIRST